MPRPLDVLVCQRSNLGWGTAAHRQYAYFLTGALVVLLVAAAAVTWLVDDGVFIALALAASAKELFELAREHRTSAESKERTESKVRKVWDQALRDPSLTHLELPEIGHRDTDRTHQVALRSNTSHLSEAVGTLQSHAMNRRQTPSAAE